MEKTLEHSRLENHVEACPQCQTLLYEIIRLERLLAISACTRGEGH